jgi:hypothetical protein
VENSDIVASEVGKRIKFAVRVEARLNPSNSSRLEAKERTASLSNNSAEFLPRKEEPAQSVLDFAQSGSGVSKRYGETISAKGTAVNGCDTTS